MIVLILCKDFCAGRKRVCLVSVVMLRMIPIDLIPDFLPEFDNFLLQSLKDIFWFTWLFS